MNTHVFVRIVILIALFVVALTACTSDASPSAAPPIDPSASGPTLGSLTFEAFELEFQPAPVQVDTPGRYAVTLTNIGHTNHDWVVAGTRLLAKPGQTVSGEIVVPADGLEFVCSFPGHAAAGMRGRITVNGTVDAQGGSGDVQK